MPPKPRQSSLQARITATPRDAATKPTINFSANLNNIDPCLNQYHRPSLPANNSPTNSTNEIDRHSSQDDELQRSSPPGDSHVIVNSFKAKDRSFPIHQGQLKRTPDSMSGSPTNSFNNLDRNSPSSHKLPQQASYSPQNIMDSYLSQAHEPSAYSPPLSQQDKICSKGERLNGFNYITSLVD